MTEVGLLLYAITLVAGIYVTSCIIDKPPR